MKAKKLTPEQKAALKAWQDRTKPGRNYSIGEVFSERDNIMNGNRRAMHRLVALGYIKPGIPGGNPLKDAV